MDMYKQLNISVHSSTYQRLAFDSLKSLLAASSQIVTNTNTKPITQMAGKMYLKQNNKKKINTKALYK